MTSASFRGTVLGSVVAVACFYREPGIALRPGASIGVGFGTESKVQLLGRSKKKVRKRLEQFSSNEEQSEVGGRQHQVVDAVVKSSRWIGCL